MGSDLEKNEKKRLKAQYKLEKKRAKQDDMSKSKQKTSTFEPKQDTTSHQNIPPPGTPQAQRVVPWYKDPNWIKAIAGIASLIVMIIALLIALYR